jgi:hypothetical protein
MIRTRTLFPSHRSGLPVGKRLIDGARSEAELGPVSITSHRSGLPVGKRLTDGARSEAEMGPVSITSLATLRLSIVNQVERAA